MVKKAFVILLLAVSVSCGKLDIKNMLLPLSKDVNLRVSESLAWNASTGVKIITVPADDYRWYICSDVHIEDSQPANLLAMVQAEKADPNAYFYQLLGDLIFGTEHMDWVTDIIDDPENDPGFVIIGNHDLFFDNWDAWKAAFHTSTYYYFVQTPGYKDIYIMLDSANGTLGEKQTAWLEDVLSSQRPGCRYCFVSVHTNIFRTDLTQFPSTNFTLEETYYLLDLMSRSSVDMMVAGHDQFRDVTTYNGVTYITLDQIKDGTSNASYMKVNVGQTVDYQFVSIND